MIHSIHRGQYLQRGHGIGGIFSSLFRYLKPFITGTMRVGRKALSDPSVKEAVSSLKKSSIKAGTRAINKEIAKIAPVKVVPKKNAPKRMPPSAAKKRILSSLNSVKKNKKMRTDSNIFNE